MAPTSANRSRSILKATTDSPKSKAKGMAVSSAKTAQSSSAQSTVCFGPPSNVADLLESFNMSALNEFVTQLQHADQQGNKALIAWLQIMTDNVALLSPTPYEPLVVSLLKVQWFAKGRTSSDDDVTPEMFASLIQEQGQYDDSNDASVAAFTHFIANLVTAHPSYVRPVVLMLIKHMQDANLGKSGIQALHAAFRTLFQVSPLHSSSAVMRYAPQCTPYFLSSDWLKHLAYFTHLLTLCIPSHEKCTVVQALPSTLADRMHDALLGFAFERCVLLDSHLPKLDEPEDGEDDGNDDSKNVTADDSKQLVVQSDVDIARRHLDGLMTVLFTCVDVTLGPDQKGKDAQKCNETATTIAWSRWLKAFESHILPGHESSSHVQFLLFRAMAIRPDVLPTQFVTWLWRTKFNSDNCGGGGSSNHAKASTYLQRRSAVSYIGSLVARANFITFDVMCATLTTFCRWIHHFIDIWTQAKEIDLQDSAALRQKQKNQLPLPAVDQFRAACQTVFYILAFRQSEFDAKAHASFFSTLHLARIVGHPNLNPLRFCSDAVVTNFSAFARAMNIYNCDPVITRNARLNRIGAATATAATKKKDSDDDNAGSEQRCRGVDFFPFDPYHLGSSVRFVRHHYRKYVAPAPIDEAQESDENNDNDDDGDEDVAAISCKRRRRNSSRCEADNILHDLIYDTAVTG